MALELTTLFLFVMVLALKYGAVTRILRLNLKLREADNRCRRQRDLLKLYRTEYMVAKREEEGLGRQRAALVGELHRVTGALDGLKQENREIVQELLRKNARLDPDLQNHDEPASGE